MSLPAMSPPANDVRHPHPTAPRRDRDDDHMAGVGGCRVRGLAARVAAVIRVEAVWLAVEPLDMRIGTESALARVVAVFGAAHPHHAYLFTNRRSNRMKVLVHDGYRRVAGGSPAAPGPLRLAHGRLAPDRR